MAELTPDGAFVLEREFAAPPATVWRAWTEPEWFARWYKPNPSCETTVHRFELKPGGELFYEMRFGPDAAHFEHWVFTEVEPPGRLRFHHAVTDADGNPAPNPQMPDWPRRMDATIELAAHGDGTLQRLTWRPHEPTPSETAAFAGAGPMLDRGWVGGFDNLAALLQELA